MPLYCTVYKPSTIHPLTSAFLSPAEVSIKSSSFSPLQWLTIHTYSVYCAPLCYYLHLLLCSHLQVLSSHCIAFLSPAEYITHLCAIICTSCCTLTFRMNPSVFDFELCKALFHAVGEADFSVIAWPLSILM